MYPSLQTQSARNNTVATADNRSTTERPTTSHPSSAGRIRFCGLCGHQNPGEIDHCLNCNAPLGKNCPNCTQPVPTGSKFCGHCGTRLTNEAAALPAPITNGRGRSNLRTRIPTALAEKITAASVKRTGERREATIVFLDVANFTAAARILDNEDVYNFINDAMSTLVQVIRKYGGTIDKFTGDGLMAIFGAPVAHENDPERAVRASLEMQTALQPLREHIRRAHGFNFQVRIGINSGWVVAGKLGNDFHKEYTVVGDTVNLASRLEGAAEPDTILVSAETYQRTRGRIKYETLLPLTVKGIPSPVQVYRPVAVLEKPESGQDGLSAFQPSMVGRSHELTQLQDAMVTVRQFNQRQIALITGEAGVGKSRLVAEFRRALNRTTVKIFFGSCSSYTHNSPLSAVARLVRNILDLSESAPVDYQRGVLQKYVDAHNLESGEILPYLTHVLGLQKSDDKFEARLNHLDAATLQRQTHTALRHVLMAESRQSPLVIIFEDMHWIDSASKDFVEYLIQTMVDVPVLLVLVSRETYGQNVIWPLLNSAEKDSERLINLSLKPLGVTDIESLVDQLITGASADTAAFKRRIAKRTEGNPFYTEEIIRMLIDQGGLVRSKTSDLWEITPQSDKLLNLVPGTVNGLILARLDSLPESVRQTLQISAVIGSSFPASLLKLVNDTDTKTMVAHLNELEARQFLRPQPFHSEPGYAFRHALTQETAYSTLLKRDQSRIHTQVAQAIEQNLDWPLDEKTEALAYHYVRSTEPAQGIPHLIGAAKNSARRCAYQAAIEHYRWAAKLLPAQPNGNDQQYFQVQIGLGSSLKFVGELAEAGQVLSALLQHLWSSSKTPDSADIWPVLVESLRQLADVRQREGVYEEAIALLEAGLQVLGEKGAQEQPLLWHSLLDRMAWIRFRQGRLEEATALARAGTTDFNPDETKDPIELASLYNTLGGISWQQGNLDKAISYVEQSLRLHEEAGHSWGKAIAYGNLGVLYDTMGNWPKALDHFNQAHTLQETIGDRQHRIVNLNNLGLVYLRMGRHKAARQALETGLSLAVSMGDTWGEALCHTGLAEISFIQPNLEDVKYHVEKALGITDTIGSSEIKVQACRFLALLLATDKQEFQTSFKVANQALKMSQEAKLSAEEANCHRALGVVAMQAGDYDGAKKYLQDSLALSQTQKDPYRHALALVELGRLHLTQTQETRHSPSANDKTEVLTMLEEAVEKFEALGAAYDLHLAQAVLNQVQASN